MEQLVEFAEKQGGLAIKELSRDEQKKLGQFLTPPSIARFMAKRCVSGLDGDSIRILEPSAGAGVLAAALLEAIILRPERPSSVELILFELDSRLVPLLKKVVSRMRKSAKAANIKLKVSIRNEDFLLSKEALKRQPIVDAIIANPPYFKLSAKDQRATAHSYAVHGQPNIYGLFMAVCSSLIKARGKWCFITPRSWTGGVYFSAMRQYMLRNLVIDAMHIFESREEHFTDDDVLQEAIITWATAQAEDQSQIIISTSNGINDIQDAVLYSRPSADIVGCSPDRLIALRASKNLLSELSGTLDSYELKVSTGPVIAFRAEPHLRMSLTQKSVPLLWMQHIGRMKISWPINKKREYIEANAAISWMLVPNSPMVIVRRFSPKEDVRRVTASAYLGNLPGDVVGLENHLNYIYRPGGLVSSLEAMGLAAYLNSDVVDAHFRAVSGSTQVNASDLRKLPIPTAEQLRRIGSKCYEGMSLIELDAIVKEILNISENVRAIA